MQIYMQPAHMTTEQISIKQYGTVVAVQSNQCVRTFPFQFLMKWKSNVLHINQAQNQCTLSNFLINALLGDFRVEDKGREQSTV